MTLVILQAEHHSRPEPNKLIHSAEVEYPEVEPEDQRGIPVGADCSHPVVALLETQVSCDAIPFEIRPLARESHESGMGCRSERR